MKTTLCKYLSVILVVLSVSRAGAAPMFNSNQGNDYLVGSSFLFPVSIGISFNNMDREVMMKDFNRFETVMKTEKTTGVIGLDIFRWITLYGIAGGTTADFDGGTSPSKGEFGGGIRLNLLDHEIPDPLLTEDRIRINASIQQTSTKSKFAGETTKWKDTTASVLLSLVNDLESDPQFYPESLSIYAGAVYSLLDGDIDEKTSSWFVVGLEVFYTKRISFGIGVDIGEGSNSGMHANFNLRL